MRAQNTPTPFSAALAESGRLSKTAGYAVLFIALGLAKTIIGPTLPFLAEQTHVSLSAISILFTTVAPGGIL